MKTWTTLLGTDDYLPAVLTLEESRQRVQSKYPLTVICFDDLDYNTYNVLKLKNIPYQVFSRKSFNGQKRAKDYSCTIGKFYSYILKGVSQFFFIDADSYFVQNIDYLFEIPTLVLFFYDHSKDDNKTRKRSWVYKDVTQITGCIFGDFCSQERFDEAIKYINIFREDEQVLEIFAYQYYNIRIDYQEFTWSTKMVLFHETSYKIKSKFWNRSDFIDSKTYLDSQDKFWQDYPFNINKYIL